MDYKITGYEPEKLFHFFEEISAIPRGSGNEKGISDYLVKFAKDRGLEVIQDDAYNVVIKKAGSRGAEDHAPVMLQGHMDMVCEKRAGVEHDFEKDGLDLIIRDGRLTANGTTLGGDNGVAVALMLMVLDDDEIEHPPVECVFTTEEEVGLNGAKALDKSVLKARTMINMDSEDEGVATVSCAGGLRVQFTKEIQRTTVQGSLLTLKVEGLLGGHSGQDIDKERQNADLLMARMIQRLLKETKGQLVSFNGGTKDNAIPRECEASLIYESDEEAAKAEELACELAETYAEELTPAEPDFSCEISCETNRTAEAIPQDAAKEFIAASAKHHHAKRFVGQIGENIAPIIPLQRHTAPGHHAGGNNCGICGSQTDAKKRPLPQAALRCLLGLSAFSHLRHLSLPQRGADIFLPPGTHGQRQTGVFREGRAVVARSRGFFRHPPGRSPEPGGHCGQSAADGAGGVPVPHGMLDTGKGNQGVAGHTGRLHAQRVGRSHPADHLAGHAGCGRLGVQYSWDGGGIPAVSAVFSAESKNIRHIDAISIQFSYLNRSAAFQYSLVQERMDSNAKYSRHHEPRRRPQAAQGGRSLPHPRPVFLL